MDSRASRNKQLHTGMKTIRQFYCKCFADLALTRQNRIKQWLLRNSCLDPKMHLTGGVALARVALTTNHFPRVTAVKLLEVWH
jgi:hypothetical protein